MEKVNDFAVFFNNEEEFAQILGKTSYYATMQNNLSKLIQNLQPSYVIEFGTGTGNTASRIARENPNLSLVAVDNREELILNCQNNKDYKAIKNLTFIKGDLTKLENFNFINVDLVLLIYSFNYISDPLENKVQFLTHLYSKMKEGSRVIIGDWFLNDTKTYDEQDIKNLYNLRIAEGAQSVYWNFLEGGQSEEEIENATQKSETFKKHHKQLLKNIIKRKDIYPVSKEWLIDTAVMVGFTVEMSDYINNLNDALIVLRK